MNSEQFGVTALTQLVLCWFESEARFVASQWRDKRVITESLSGNKGALNGVRKSATFVVQQKK